jgi:NAD(P)-dependent dehydrogenase (short-subunit alcohol dehydrogenase family)
MSEQQPTGGSIISLSSATTKALINNHMAYIASKRAGEAMMECVANDFGHLGIRANTVSPAFTDSPMTHDSFAVPGLVDAFLPRYPLGRLNTVEDVAHACLWLSTDTAFVTGQNIQPNGGLTLRGNPQARDIEAAVGAAMAKLQAQ